MDEDFCDSGSAICCMGSPVMYALEHHTVRYVLAGWQVGKTGY